MKFEWDENKQILNIQKHSVSFIEACLVFSDEFILTIFDHKHSTHEDRWVSMGMIPYGKILVVIHTIVLIEGEELVRIISARRANLQEQRVYYERRKGQHGRPL